MFLNNKSTNSNSEKIHSSAIETLIGSTASIQGDLHTQGNVRVDGKLFGNIISTGEVVLGEAGTITGDVSSDTIIIYGTVRGNIDSKGLLEIMSTGKVYGDLNVSTLSIEEGGVFEGKSIMTTAPIPAKTPPHSDYDSDN